MQKYVFRDIKGPYIKILTQPSKWSAQINKSSPSNKKVALRKKAEINNCRGYYYSVGKSRVLNQWTWPKYFEMYSRTKAFTQFKRN